MNDCSEKNTSLTKHLTLDEALNDWDNTRLRFEIREGVRGNLEANRAAQFGKKYFPLKGQLLNKWYASRDKYPKESIMYAKEDNEVRYGHNGIIILDAQTIKFFENEKATYWTYYLGHNIGIAVVKALTEYILNHKHIERRLGKGWAHDSGYTKICQGKEYTVPYSKEKGSDYLNLSEDGMYNYSNEPGLVSEEFKRANIGNHILLRNLKKHLQQEEHQYRTHFHDFRNLH